MTHASRDAQLLDRRHVAMAVRSRDAVRVDTAQPCLWRLDSPLRLWGSLWSAAFSQHRVPTPKGETVDTAGQSDCVRGRVAGMPLQASGCQALHNQGHGFSRFLDSVMTYQKRVLIDITSAAGN